MWNEQTRRKKFIGSLRKLRKVDYVPQVGSSNRLVFLIPVWESIYINTALYARGAAYALRSWRAFTDMKDYNVASYIHIYAEETELYDRLLKENVRPEDIFIDDRPMRKPCTLLIDKQCTNKIYPILHPSFKDAEYITIIDADTFVLGSYEKPLLFWKEILSAVPVGVIGNVSTTFLEPPYTEWLRYGRGNEAAFVNPAVLERLRYHNPEIQYFSTTVFCVNRPLFLKDDWWEQALASETHGDDEYLMMLWAASDSEHTASLLNTDMCSYNWVMVAQRFWEYLNFQENTTIGMPSFIFHPEASLEYLMEQVLRQ